MSTLDLAGRLEALLRRIDASSIEPGLRDELVNELRVAVDESRRSQSRDTFIATVSHELRSPLHSVLGNTELLRERLADPEALALVNAVLRSARGLLGLINDLLDISAINAGSFALRPTSVALREIFDEVMSTCRHTYRSRHIDLLLSYDESLPHSVVIDAQRLAQLLTNLTANALRFTDSGWVEVAVSQPSGDPTQPRLRVEVIDTGIGVPPGERGNLFLPFFRSQNRAHQRGGTGLGLSICQSLASRMGGSIGYQPRKASGSIFWFEVPITPASQASPPKHSFLPFTPPPTAPQRTILVVDDTETNRVWAQIALSSRGFSVLLADSGSRALELLAQQPVDVILMDWFMPELDGFETTRLVRSLPGPEARTPIIGLSASAVPDAVQQGLDAGMDECLLKPVSIQALCAAIERHSRAPDLPSSSVDLPPSLSAFTPTSTPTAGAAPAAPAAAPPGDSQALRIEGVSADLCVELAELFAEQVLPLCDKVRQSFHGGERQALTQNVHALASASGGIQRADLCDMAKAVELKLSQGVPLDQLATEVLGLCDEFNRVAPLILEATREARQREGTQVA